MKIAIIFDEPVTKDGQFGRDLYLRLHTALRLYREGEVDVIFSAGGQGLILADGLPTAESMTTWLKNKGVPEQSLMYSTNSIDTFSNIEDVCICLQGLNPSKLLPISNKLHLRRILPIMEARMKLNDIEAEISPIQNGYTPRSLEKIKEFVLYAFTRLDPSGTNFVWRFIKSYRNFARRHKIYGYQ